MTAGSVFELAAQSMASHVLAEIRESILDIANWTISEQILLSRQQQIKPRGDDREHITRARQAAEALFTSKPPPVSTRAVLESPMPADRSTGDPRVLPILPPGAPVRHEEREMSAVPEPQTMREIP